MKQEWKNDAQINTNPKHIAQTTRHTRTDIHRNNTKTSIQKAVQTHTQQQQQHTRNQAFKRYKYVKQAQNDIEITTNTIKSH